MAVDCVDSVEDFLDPPAARRDLAGFALKLLLFESVDEFDGGEEPDALAVTLDGPDAGRDGEMRPAAAWAAH